MIHALRKNIELKIDVQSDEIVLLGHASEAAGKTLLGSLILNITESIKVKSIHLSFVGKMKVAWSEGVGPHQQYHKQERTILTHDWEFLHNQAESSASTHEPNYNHKKSRILNAGQHKWDFEFLLPGDLPQTLDSDIGSVTYRLKATVERPAFVQNSTKKRKINVIRCILPSQFELVQSLEIHNTWAQKMVYDISVPSKLFAFNDIIPISFKILPIASHLRVHAIMASIKEYCTYSTNDHTKTDTRIVRLVRLDNPFSEAVVSATSQPPTWDRILDLQVPAKSPVVFADTNNDMIRIRHRLKFVISLTNADGHISELRCAVQIILIESFAVTEELNTLPAYDEMWKSVPYAPHVVERLRTSISEAATNEPRIELAGSRQPVNITGWSRMLSVSSAPVPIHEEDGRSLEHNNEETITEEDDTPSVKPMAIPGSNSSSRHHSRRPSIEAEEEINASLSQQSLWWNGIDLGKVPSYKSVSTLDPSRFSVTRPPAYDSLAAAFAANPDLIASYSNSNNNHQHPYSR